MSEWAFPGLRMFGYDFCMIDCPWPFELWSAAGNEKSAEAQYDCMSLPEIAALPVGELMRSGGVVWMWCTWPLVATGIHADVMRKWGIEPKTGGDWAKRTVNGKLRWGPGYLLRTVCEPFIIGTIGGDHGFRGTALMNLFETSHDGLAREHSRKPDEVYRKIEEVTPHWWRADVFARQRRPDWDCYGKEINKFKEATA